MLSLAIHVSLEAMLWDRPLSLQTKSIMIRSTSSLLSCVTYSFRAGLGSWRTTTMNLLAARANSNARNARLILSVMFTPSTRPLYCLFAVSCPLRSQAGFVSRAVGNLPASQEQEVRCHYYYRCSVSLTLASSKPQEHKLVARASDGSAVELNFRQCVQ